MDIEKMAEIFDDMDEYGEFDRIEKKLSGRPDLHAFMLLDKLFPHRKDIISAAEHDEIYLSVEPSELAEVATEEQIIELVRCGVRYDEDNDSLAMFA